jgi:hypothetical protein
MGGKIEREWKVWFYGHLRVKGLEPFKKRIVGPYCLCSEVAAIVTPQSKPWRSDLTKRSSRDHCLESITTELQSDKSMEWARKCTSLHPVQTVFRRREGLGPPSVVTIATHCSSLLDTLLLSFDTAIA